MDGLVPAVSGHHRTACICPALTAGQVRFLPAQPTKEELFLPPFQMTTQFERVRRLSLHGAQSQIWNRNPWVSGFPPRMLTL